MTKKKTTRTRAEAKKLMWEYYRDNKETLPKWIRECREEVLEQLIQGQSTSDVFRSIVRSVEQDTSSEKDDCQNSHSKVAA